MAIEVTDEGLIRRQNTIRDLLHPMVSKTSSRTKRKTTVACQRLALPTGVIWATHDGARPHTAYRDWRFTSYERDFRCMYFEMWHPLDAQRSRWTLHQLAFSLFRTLRLSQEELEILAIHCDPLEPDGAHAIYKRGPHLHVSHAVDPLPHAHFALCNGRLRQVLESADAISSAIGESLEMIRQEVLCLPWRPA